MVFCIYFLGDWLCYHTEGYWASSPYATNKITRYPSHVNIININSY